MPPNTREYYRLAKGSGGVASNNVVTVAVPAATFKLIITTGIQIPLKQDEALWVKSYFASMINAQLVADDNLFFTAPPGFDLLDVNTNVCLYEQHSSSFFAATGSTAANVANGQVLGTPGGNVNAFHGVVYARDIWVEADDFTGFLGAVPGANSIPLIRAAGFFQVNNSSAAALNVAWWEVLTYEVWKRGGKAAGGVPLGGPAYARKLPDFRP